MQLHDTINKHNKNRGFTVGIFLDLEKAYDTVWKNGLLTKVKRLGISGKMFKFIQDFITERSFQVRVGAEKSESMTLENGTPQGSVISPTLFLIMINDLRVSTPGVQLSIFADDSAVYKSGRKLNLVIKHLQESLDQVQNWCNEWGMKISTSKSSVVIFTHKVKYNVEKPLKLYNQELKVEKFVKFLGVFFDSRLTFHKHATYTKEKCYKRLNLLRCVSGTTWGASKACLLTLYRSLIRPLLEYGALILDTACSEAKRILSSIQVQSLSLCCGAMRGTPLSALQVESGELPLDISRLKKKLQYAAKVKLTADHPSQSLLTDHWANYYGKDKETKQSIYSCTKEFLDQHDRDIENIQQIKPPPKPPWTLKEMETDLSLSHEITKQDLPCLIETSAKVKIEEYKDNLAVYTDGSKNLQGRVSFSFHIPELNVSESFRISDNQSVYVAELSAISAAVSWLATEGLERFQISQNIVIFSDSLSAVKSIAGKQTRSCPAILQNLMQVVDKIDVGVMVVWIPGHSNICGNDVADALAKQALENEQINLAINPEYSYFLEKINKYVENKWQNRWNDSETGNFYKTVNPAVTSSLPFYHSNRKTEVTVMRLRFGQCRLNYTLHKMQCHPTGLCETCKTPETIKHHLMECTESTLCEKLKNICSKENIPFTLTEILKQNKILMALCSHITRSL